jgi:hypothetical protein
MTPSWRHRLLSAVNDITNGDSTASTAASKTALASDATLTATSTAPAQSHRMAGVNSFDVNDTMTS